MPERYAVTRAYLLMRVGERYGQDPFEMEANRSPEEMELLIDQETLRMAEEEARFAASAASASIGGPA